MALLQFLIGWAAASGLVIQSSGRVITKSSSAVVFESETTRYKIRVPKADEKLVFALLPKGKAFTLEADSRLILSKELLKNSKGVK